LDDPIISTEAIGTIDYVLLTHDHHFDNLDREGRKMLSLANTVYTTPVGAGRLDGNAIGLKTWETTEIPTHDGRRILLTGTPCRHGPVGGDREPVTGFILRFKEDPDKAIYITGDTVLYEGVLEVARRLRLKCHSLFGCGSCKPGGPAHLTMTVEEGIGGGGCFRRIIVPMHFEGWAHFTNQNRN
jgi:hypothetical protein